MYSSAYHGSGAPPWVSRPSQGGGVSPRGQQGGPRGRGASGCPLVGGADGGGGRGGGLPAVPLRSPGAAPCWLQGDGLVVLAPGGQPLTGGGRTPLLVPSTLRALGRRAGPHPWARRSPRCRRLAAWFQLGGGGRACPCWGGGPGPRASD